jgi:hypothetical protein
MVAAACWNDATDTSKWMIARAGLPVPGSGVEFEMTHVFVSGEMYGLAWYTSPGRSANVGAKNGAFDSSAERSATGARTPSV